MLDATPTMTQDEREGLEAALTKRFGLALIASLSVDALAPIIERLVAERVAAETERCAKTLVYGWFKCDGDYTRQLAAIRSATRCHM